MSTYNEQSGPPSTARNYNTISPSARALLLLKGYTTIPYARDAAALIQYPEPYSPNFNRREPGFWTRVMHFEARYWSINQLIPGDITNFLELSSGFSFRGLALAMNQPVHYIDTDLPDLIVTKQELVKGLLAGTPPPRGRYELQPLNALDATAFNTIIDSFPPGPIVILNEGLLMYLEPEEKRQLCQLIHDALKERGGYWITADIYLRRDMPDDPELSQGDDLKQFLEQHKVQEKMFNTFEEAEQLFTSAGLVIDKEAEPDYSTLTALPHLLDSASPELIQRLRNIGKIHATWRLRVE